MILNSKKYQTQPLILYGDERFFVLLEDFSAKQKFGFATPQAIYKWQQGISLPTVDNLVVLAAVFQVKIDDILVVDD